MENIKSAIIAEITVHAPVAKCWELWGSPAAIRQWNAPSDEWHSPLAEIDLKDEGHFLFRMETKDGSVGFDHGGKYDNVKVNESIAYTVADGRKTFIKFTANGDDTNITETFEPEAETPVDMQKDFCQAILNNFKKYAETH